MMVTGPAVSAGMTTAGLGAKTGAWLSMLKVTMPRSKVAGLLPPLTPIVAGPITWGKYRFVLTAELESEKLYPP